MVFTSQQSLKKSSGNSSSGGDDSKKRKSMMNRRGASSSNKFEKSGSGYRGHGGRGGSRKIDDYSGFVMDERRSGGGRGGGGKENVVDKRFYDGEKDILCLCFGIMYILLDGYTSPVVILLLFFNTCIGFKDDFDMSDLK